MSSEYSLNIDEIRACLDRSGYLMESRLVRALSGADFFVEPNVAHKDPRTGKSREVDLVAEDASLSFHPMMCVKTTFVVEAVNNRFPFVLLTERPSTPGSNFENYIKVGWSEAVQPFFSKFDLYGEKKADWENLFSQYCVLSKKNSKDELMASHPDDIYGSFLKLAEYTENEMKGFADWQGAERYWRMFFWQPMLVVSGQLVTVMLGEDGTPQLRETPMGRLEFNWHDVDAPQTTVIEVVREDYFLERVKAIRAHDADIETRMHDYRIGFEAAL